MTSAHDWPVMPRRHRDFLEQASHALAAFPTIQGIAAGGSFVTGELDELSDLDLVLAVDPEHWPEILDRRLHIAAELGRLLAAFTGEHVGEPRLLICLYGPPLLHVDLKFVSLDDAHERVEDPVVLWERGGRLSASFARAEARYPEPDHDWIEDRFWVWVHYGADKIERGELFEALDMLGFLRTQVLGPLGLERAGARPDRVRRLEAASPDFADRLRETVPAHNAESCTRALQCAIDLYLELRPEGRDPAGSRVEREVRAYVAGLPGRLGLGEGGLGLGEG